jgi:RNA polymerase primary sigma factor
MMGRTSQSRRRDRFEELYLRQVEAIPTLTGAEEREVAREIRRNQVARSVVLICDPAELTPEEVGDGEERLHPDTIWQVEIADACIEQLRHQLVRANLGLVVKLARRYDFGLVPLLDLIQEGNVGLIAAVDRFDHSRGVRLATFAYPWIRHAMRKALAHTGHAVRVPAHLVDARHRLREAVEKFELGNGRPPDDRELAGLLDIPLERLERLRATGRIRVVPFEDTFAAPDESPVASILIDRWEREKARVMGVLTEIERSIISLRFGLAGGDALSLRQVGERSSLSKERIRQIQNAALEKLRLAFDPG